MRVYRRVMQSEPELIRALLGVARTARRYGPASIAAPAAKWEAQFEAALERLSAPIPPLRRPGRRARPEMTGDTNTPAEQAKASQIAEARAT